MTKSKLRRFISLILALVVAAGICPITASASSGGYQYEIVSDNIVITGYTGSETNVTIPWMIGERYVVGIGDMAFYNSGITSLTLHNNISRIGFSAFLNCTSLRTVNFAEIDTHLDEYAFGGCTALTSVYMPYGIKSIGTRAFSGCSSLRELTLPESLSSVETNAFNGVPEDVDIYFDGWQGTWNKVNFQIGNESVQYATNIKFATPCSHEYNSTISIPATCKRVGLKELYCPICYDISFQDIPTNNNHNYKTVYDTPIDCIKDSLVHDECADCGKELPGSSGTIPAEGHDFSVFVSYTAPTYTTEGKTVYDCLWCNYRETTFEPKLPRIELAGAKITVSNKTYTGEYLKPSPSVTLDGVKLKKNTDYTVSYKNNKNVGTATVTVKGKGKYTGTRKVTFKIKAIKLSKAKISVSDKTYSGKALKPSPTVKLDGKKLKKNTDYTVSYKNNKKVGTATVTVKGKGKYTGTRKVTFKIKPKNTTLSSVKSKAKKSATLKWKKNSTAGGYRISIATNKKFTKNQRTVWVKKADAKSTTIKKLKSNKTYYVRIRAYKTVKGKKYWGKWSKVKKVKVK